LQDFLANYAAIKLTGIFPWQ